MAQTNGTGTGPVNLNGTLTLVDWKNRFEGDAAADIIELLSQNNAILEDLPFKQANEHTSNVTTVRVGLPAVYWRMINSGIPNSKSVTARVRDTIGMLESVAIIDKAEYDMAPDPNGFILGESMAFLEAMNQEMAKAVFYSNEKSNGESITGLSPRYSTLDVTKAASAANVIDAGGRGSENASIWLCCWGDRSGYAVFPRGSMAGVQMVDTTTEALVSDGQGGMYQAMQYLYKWHMGLVIKDWRYFVRIANIDVSKLGSPEGADLCSLLNLAMIKAPTMPAGSGPVQQNSNGTSRIGLSFGKPVIYVNRTMSAAISSAAMNKNNVLLEQMQWDGTSIASYRGIPIKVVDALLNTESAVQ